MQRYGLSECVRDLPRLSDWSEDRPKRWRYWLRALADRLWWNLRGFVWDRHHVLVTELRPTYNDPSEVLLYAAFAGFLRYCEDEDGIGYAQWAANAEDDEHACWSAADRERYATIIDLYDWWTVRRPARAEPTYDGPSPQRLGDWPQSYRDHLADLNRQDAEWSAEDQAMLHRLIDVRHSLWT